MTNHKKIPLHFPITIFPQDNVLSQLQADASHSANTPEINTSYRTLDLKMTTENS